MSKCTKGKLYVTKDYYGGLRISIVPTNATNIDGSGSIFENTGRGAGDISEANAKELVRRWNAFEDGGIVEELRTTLENALTTLAIISMPRQDDNVATDTELLKILGDSFRAALAKS